LQFQCPFTGHRKDYVAWPRKKPLDPSNATAL
jgi:hypothetical protein